VARSLVFLLAASLAAAPACTCSKAGDGAAGLAEEAAAVALAPVPAPDGLLADVFLATPNATWQGLQRKVGGTLGILPSTLGGLVCALAGLDPNLGPEIDGAALVTGAVADDAVGVAWAIAMKIGEPRRAHDLLFDAETARYTPRAVGDMTVLAPKGGGPMPLAAALGAGGYLVLARSEADLSRLGPYAFRTVPTKTLPAGGALVLDAPSAALKGPLRARLASLWDAARGDLASKDDAQRAAHGGRAPDYADPRAILALLDGAMQRRLALLGDLDAARLVVDVLDGSVRADLIVTPGGPSGPSAVAFGEMRPGDASPLLDGTDSPLALLFRDDAAGRVQTAADVEDAVKRALGERLSEGDAKRLHTTVDGWTKARGDWTTLGLLGQDGLFLRAPAVDAEAADHAIRSFLALVGTAPLKQGLRIQDVSVGAGTAQVAYGEPASPGKGPGPKKASVAWTAKAGEIAVTLTAPSSAPAPAPSAAKKLGDEPVIADAVRALDKTVTFAAVVQPLKLDPVRALQPAAPIVVAWGRKEKNAYLRLDGSLALVRELIKMRSGL
jgi:hypothetical protein